MDAIIAFLAVVIVAWFAGGTIANVRKGRAVMRWMQAGLPLLGARATVRWLGSTAVEMAIADARAPFAQATLVIFLEPRDLPWMWALGRSRGRRDLLIVRGVLQQVPSVELEALDPASWSGRDALRRVPAEWLVCEPKRQGGLVVHHRETDARRLAERLLTLAEREALDVRRLSVRAAEPNFQLHVALPDGRKPARDYFAAVRLIAEGALA